MFPILNVVALMKTSLHFNCFSFGFWQQAIALNYSLFIPLWMSDKVHFEEKYTVFWSGSMLLRYNRRIHLSSGLQRLHLNSFIQLSACSINKNKHLYQERESDASHPTGEKDNACLCVQFESISCAWWPFSWRSFMMHVICHLWANHYEERVRAGQGRYLSAVRLDAALKAQLD